MDYKPTALYEALASRLAGQDFLEKLSMSLEDMLSHIEQEQFAKSLEDIHRKDKLLCTEVLGLCEEIMNSLSLEPPKGWLDYSFQYILHKSFPETATTTLHKKYESSVLIYLEVLRTLRKSKEEKAFSKFQTFEFLTESELEALPKADEYMRFIKAFEDNYLYELMQIDEELHGQNTLNHVAAVHYVAMHVARQLKKTGSHINLGLVSGAAAGHDIGKYGCKESEQARVPYLHYYYTDQWFKRFDLPGIGLIASNHSTWDLELENLPIESLVLIYADFRVKNKFTEKGREMHIFSLCDSFDVILEKLDNVDEAKEKRYKKVYAKLRDFENYMVKEGVHVDFTSSEPRPAKTVDYALLDGCDVVESFKHMAIEHNTSLLNRLNNEAIFSGMIESARSEQNWEKIRAYLNVLDEYSIYLSQKEKVSALNFLYDMLIHREADIRRQAAKLMGNIIVHYDPEFTKEKPKDSQEEWQDEANGLTFWDRYLSLFIDSGHKMTDKHKEWMGYSMRMFVNAVMLSEKNKDKGKYLQVLIQKIKKCALSGGARFSVLNSLLSIPAAWYSEEQLDCVIEFALAASKEESLKTRVMALQYLHMLSKCQDISVNTADKLWNLVAGFDQEDGICANYLKGRIARNLNEESAEALKYEEFLEKSIENTSAIFLNNLKSATPWNVKIINIDYIMGYIKNRSELALLQTATHLTNLLKASEKGAVRTKAGNALIEIGPFLTVEQRNEIAVELFKGLEIDELQYAQYIPRYLGRFVLLLPPRELDECIQELATLYKGPNPRVSALAINALGILAQYYPGYQYKSEEDAQSDDARYKKILGMLFSGLANYNAHVKQETFLVIGQHIFGSKVLDLEEKYQIFTLAYKKLLTLINEEELSDLFFFNNSSSFNHIYRFISNYEALHEDFAMQTGKKVAFFPGTFDPFSLGHKGIATAIRDLGYEVYLSLDEFSWSKRMQPRMIRRQIINMSIADELGIFLFPDNIPINLSSAKDLRELRALFEGKEVYMVVGSDVLENATAYKSWQTKDSIQSFNHIVFSRMAGDTVTAPSALLEENKKKITGEIVELKLPTYLEDISSTQIRDNVDGNKDISTLIDPLAQSFIYDKNLYTREPLHKGILKSKPILVQLHKDPEEDLLDEVRGFIALQDGSAALSKEHLLKSKAKILLVRDKGGSGKILGAAVFHALSVSDVYREIQSQTIANHIREHAAGKIMVIDGIFVETDEFGNMMEQITLTETLAYCLQNDYTYALFCNSISRKSSARLLNTLNLQGFVKIHDEELDKTVYGVDMRSAISLTLNMLSVIKEPLNSNPHVARAVSKARKMLQRAITELYPGTLVLSIDNDMINQKLTDKICAINKVPNETQVPRVLGEHMCVPFGDILKGMVIPNTVTKSLHTEKFYATDAKSFKIVEYPFYSPIENQVKTIKSFERPVILVDDILHKGYRIKELDPVLKRHKINVSKIIVGIMSGRGRDLMEIQERECDSAYFIPNLKLWFNENLMYPFLGGDGMGPINNNALNLIPSINMILPFYAPMYIRGTSKEAIYNLSMVSLKNAKIILKALEDSYQELYGKKLTTKRLGEVLLSPRLPYLGEKIHYDLNWEASAYMDVLIENLEKLERIIKE